MMQLTPKKELDRRIAGLQALLRDQDLDGALIVQNTDLFYFSGTSQQAHLYVPASGEALLLVRKSYERARRESALASVAPMGRSAELPVLLAAHDYALPRRLGLEMDVLPANLYLAYQRLLPGEMVDISPLIRQVRMVKSPYEVAIISRAAEALHQVFGQVGEHLREGMTEVELAGRVEMLARSLGHPGIVRMRTWNQEMFYGHLLAGTNSTVPSYVASPTGGAGLTPAFAQGAGSRPIARHEPILLDYIGAADGYLVDQTRIFSLGPLADHLVTAHRAMLEVQRTVVEAARPGVLCADLYQLAVDTAAALGYGEYFMGPSGRQVPFVGHGVGLDLDEWPILTARSPHALKAGMVFALEPKLLLPEGVVGIENTFAVGPEGLQRLTLTPDEILVIQ
jgi:Xaa-Pro aminopeptidase